MTTDVKFRLNLDGDGQVKAGLAGVGDAFAVSAEDALKLEKATAAAAVAQAKLDAAVAKSTAAQAAFAKASRDATASQTSIAEAARKAAEAQAQQAAAAARLREQSAALKTLEDAQRGVATQSKLTTYQTAQLSAQLQDLFVQIQAGGNPLTALIQQGSQLSAVFGGVGPALAAAGSLISPLVVGVGSLAAAALALGLAWASAHREGAQFRTDLALTGNAAGVTADSVRTAADRISKDTKASIGTSREALATLIATGRVSGDALQATAGAAAALARATGESAADIAKRFASMADNVAEAAAKLNQQYHFLSLAQYQQIKALEDQGRAQEALVVLMGTLEGQINRTVTQLDGFDRAWLDVANSMSKFKDGFVDLFRDATPQQQLDRVKAQLAELAKSGQTGYVFGPSAAELKKKAELLQLQVDLASKLAKGDADEAARREAAVKFEQKIVEAMSEREKIQKRLADLASQGTLAGKSGAEIGQVVNNALLNSPALAQSVAEAQARVDAAAEVTQAKVRAQLQALQSLFDIGLVRQADYLQRVTDLEVKALEADRARLAQQLAGARQRASLGDDGAAATVASLGGQITAKSIEIDARRKKGVDDLTAAYLKQSNAIRDAMLALREEGQSQIDQQLDRENQQRNALIRSLEDYRVAVLEAIEGTKVEADALGKTERERRILIEQFKIELDLRRRIREIEKTELPGTPADVAAERARLIAQATATANTAKANVPSIVDNDEFEKLKAKLIDGQSAAKDFGAALKTAFGEAGGALAGLSDALTSYAQRQKDLAKDRARIDALAEDTPEKIRQKADLQQALGRRVAESQIASYADMAGAAKGFFKEGTTGYKALEAAETAFRAFQLASNAAAAVASITQSQAIGAASVGPAIAKEGSISGIYGALAMAALLAAIGVAGAGSGKPTVTAAQRQAGNATGQAITAAQLDPNSAAYIGGTVLGDAGARSESISKSLEALVDKADITLPITSSMAASLRNIDANTAGLASVLARSASGGLTTGKNLGIFQGVVSVNKGDPILNAFGIDDNGRNLPVIGGFIEKLQGLFGKVKQTVTDAGLSIGATVGDLIGGTGVQQYADVTTTKSSLFGLIKKSSTDTVFGNVDEAVAQQFGLIFQNVADTLKAAAGPLGKNSDEIAAAVGNFYVDIARLSLKDLKGQDLQDALNAAIGAQFDSLAKQVLPGLEGFQKVGEGYFETLTRVASGVEQADQALSRFGITAVDYTTIIAKQGDVATEIVKQSIEKIESSGGTLNNIGKIIDGLTGSATDIANTYSALKDLQAALRAVGISGDTLSVDLIKGAGSLDSLKGSLGDYLSGFFTDQERLNSSVAALTGQFKGLGIDVVPQTREQFKALVQQLVAAGPASADLLAKVLGLSGAFADAAAAADAITGKRQSLQAQLLRAQGDEAGAVRLEREAYLASLRKEGDGLAELQQQIYDFTDAAEAASAAIERAAKPLSGLQATSDALKAQRQTQADAKQLQSIYGSITQDQLRSVFTSVFDRQRFDAGTLPQAQIDAARNLLAVQKFDLLSASPASDAAPRDTSSSGGIYDDKAQQIAQQQLDATHDLIRQLDSLEQSLGDYMDSLLTGDLSPLSPKEQYDQARALVESVGAQAKQGNLQAGEAIKSAIDQFLRASEAYNARGTVYTADFNFSRDLLAQIKAVMERIETAAKQNTEATAASGESITGAIKDGNSITAQSIAYQTLQQAINAT